jgi:hypothetical protein
MSLDQSRKPSKWLITSRLGISGLLAWCADTAFSQEALRESVAGEKAALARKQGLENANYNFKAGPVKFLFDADLSVELNDNVNVAEQDRQEDLILRPQLNLRSFWPITEVNSVNLTVGLGYAKYFNNPQYDRFVVRPDSELSFDIYVRNFRINLFDRFSYTQDPLSQGSVSGIAEYGGLSNTGGLTVDWDLNKLMVSFGYSHFNFISAVPQYDYINRGSDLFFARGGYQTSSATVVGLEATGGLTDYDENIKLGDNSTYSVGLFATWQVTSKLRVNPRVGYVSYSFDPSVQTPTGNDANTYYFSIGVNHQISEFVSYSIDAGRESQLGINTDYLQLYFVRAQAAWNIIRKVGIVTEFFYENGEETRISSGEIFDRFGAAITLSHQFTEKLNTHLTYRFTTKDSDIPLKGYNQSYLLLGLNYRF